MTPEQLELEIAWIEQQSKSAALIAKNAKASTDYALGRSEAFASCAGRLRRALADARASL